MLNDFIAAVLIGLLGAGHCLGMCGGIASAITFSADKEKSKLILLFLFSFTTLGELVAMHWLALFLQAVVQR